VEEPDQPGPTVLIRFDRPGNQLTGSIRVNDGPEHSFAGWLELLRELERARPSPATDQREAGTKCELEGASRHNSEERS
jgi:hypothetical protein